MRRSVLQELKSSLVGMGTVQMEKSNLTSLVLVDNFMNFASKLLAPFALLPALPITWIRICESAQ